MVKIVQNSFLGGQLDWEMMGRQDISKYSKGATELVNFQLMKRGAMYKRPGTNLLHDVSSRVRTGAVRLVPFYYTPEDGWCLLVVNGAMYAANRERVVAVGSRDGAEFFTGSQVEEFDYHQCGDVVFMAHRGRRPCCVKHTLSGASHVFTLEDIDLNRQAEGVPLITGATVSKTGITTKGPSVTEHYKATAVYDGVETFPSADYYDANCADYDEGYDSWQEYLQKCDKKDKICSREYQPALKTYSGTSYTTPWTQSQRISLSISVPSRVADGRTERPEEIRVYRKTGTYYGLVGRVDTSEYRTATSATISAGAVTATYLSSVDGVERAATGGVTDAGAPGNAFGAHGDGFKVTGPFTLALGASVKKATVSIRLGHVAYALNYEDVAGEDGAAERTLSSAVFTYRPGGCPQFAFRLGTGPEKTVRNVACSASVRTKTVTLAQDADLEDTWRSHLAAFAASIPDADGVQVDLTASEASSVVAVAPSTEAVVVNNVSASSSAIAASTVTFDDNYVTPDVSLTPPKRADVMNAAGEWPACVCLSQQRLIWASTENDPARVFMSEVGNFYVYAPHSVQVDSDAIDFSVSSSRFQKVNHIVELRKLLMFDGAAEWVVDSASSASGITYATIQAIRHSGIGCSATLKPIVCNNVVLFAERTGQAVRQYGFQLEDDGYGGTDVSILASSIFREARIVSWAFQQHPHMTCWCVLSDGTLASLTFVREQDTIAWARHELGGGGKALAVVCTEALVGGDGGGRTTSQVFLLVDRGGAKTIEEMRADAKRDGDTVANSMCLDSMRVLGGSDARRDGAVVVNPATGERTDRAWAGMIEGFPYEARFTSVYPVVADAVGMAQMDVKYVHGVGLRLCHAVGGTVRAVDVPDAEASRIDDAPVAVVAGRAAYPPADARVLLAASNNRDGRVVVRQDTEWPFGVLMLETDLEVEEGGRGERR